MPHLRRIAPKDLKADSILLAYPGATLFSFDATPIAQVTYGELENIKVTRDFLMDPERFLRQLMKRE